MNHTCSANRCWCLACAEISKNFKDQSVRAQENELALARLETAATVSMLLDVQKDAIEKGKRIAELESAGPIVGPFESVRINKALEKIRRCLTTGLKSRVKSAAQDALLELEQMFKGE